MIRKVRPHITQNEDLIFERSSPGKIGYQLPALDVPAVDPKAALGSDNVRDEIADFPEVSEVEVIRHFTRLSTWNYAIDLGMYPLGSCTMKYNPRVNELVARLDGMAWAHPYQPEELSQGSMEVVAQLEQALLEITGLDAVTLQPAAGAHGELTGILLVRALLESRGNPRKRILVPDSAHGTNPATAMMAGYTVGNIKSNAKGLMDVEQLARIVDEDVAAVMVTNPSTLGVFEENIVQCAEILHAKGAMLYMDGANMNALVPFLPTPRLAKKGADWTWNYDLPQSIGRVRAFYGNFGVLVRALAYIMAHGGPGLRNATVDALLNANYIRYKLAPYFDLPYDSPNMHEVVFSDQRQAKKGVRTGDMAKRLIDYGFHPIRSASRQSCTER